MVLVFAPLVTLADEENVPRSGPASALKLSDTGSGLEHDGSFGTVHVRTFPDVLGSVCGFGPTVDANSPAPNVNWLVPCTYRKPCAAGMVTAMVAPPTGHAMEADAE